MCGGTDARTEQQLAGLGGKRQAEAIAAAARKWCFDLLGGDTTGTPGINKYLLGTTWASRVGVAAFVCCHVAHKDRIKESFSLM